MLSTNPRAQADGGSRARVRHDVARASPLGTIGIPIAGFDLPWGIDIMSREREANPAVRVVIDSLTAAAKHKAHT